MMIAHSSFLVITEQNLRRYDLPQNLKTFHPFFSLSQRMTTLFEFFFIFIQMDKQFFFYQHKFSNQWSCESDTLSIYNDLQNTIKFREFTKLSYIENSQSLSKCYFLSLPQFYLLPKQLFVIPSIITHLSSQQLEKMYNEGQIWDLKRQDFRNQIRQRHIEKIKKKKREVVQITNAYNKSMEIYGNVLKSPQLIFEHHEKYLQILHQAFKWEGVLHFNKQMPEVLLKMIDYYEKNMLQGTDLILFWECVACIYYQTNIPFQKISQKIIQFCLEELKPKNKSLFKGCLLVLENMACTENEQTLLMVLNSKVLDILDDYVETYPFDSHTKLQILGLLGNLIELQLKVSENTWYYPNILFNCLMENNSFQICQKGVQICILLLESERVDFIKLFQELEDFLFTLSQVEDYIPQLQTMAFRLICKMVEFPQTHHIKLQIYFKYLDNIINNLSKHDLKKEGLCNYLQGCSLMIDLGEKIMGFNGAIESLAIIAEGALNMWLEHEGDFDGQYELLNFILLCFEHELIFSELIKSKNNFMNAPVWEILIGFLKQVSIEKQSNIFPFIKIMSLKELISMIPKSDLQDLYYKVEGCFNQLNENDPVQSQFMYLTQAALNNIQKLL